MTKRKGGSGTAKARLNLIHDQQDAVIITELTQVLSKCWRH